MGFFGMLFWIAVLWLLLRSWRRTHYWVPIAPYGYPRYWYRKADHGQSRAAYPRSHKVERDDEYIESLETRLSQLEERLDFTERLLESRGGTKT